jgi:hypothetical protein
LLAESKYPGCTRLAEIMEDLSHDSVNRFLLRERYEPKDLFIYNKQEGKTKNDYLREMIAEVLTWGLSPETITTDTWYSSQKNLKFFKDKGLGFLTGILELMRAEELIENWYELQRNLSLQVARDFILEHLTQKLDLSA